jgi:hypothetical protein
LSIAFVSFLLVVALALVFIYLLRGYWHNGMNPLKKMCIIIGENRKSK